MLWVQVVVNKLSENVFTQQRWGSEILWALTDGFMCKTIEIPAGQRTSLIAFEKKEKSIIIVKGTMRLWCGSCCDEKEISVYELKEGWSWYIHPGMLHRYEAPDGDLMLMEVSTPVFEEGIVLPDGYLDEIEDIIEKEKIDD